MNASAGGRINGTDTDDHASGRLLFTELCHEFRKSVKTIVTQALPKVGLYLFFLLLLAILVVVISGE